MSKFGSRKFLLALLVMAASVGAPILFHKEGVSDAISMLAIGIIGGIGAAYHVVNVAELKAGAKDDSKPSA